MEWKLCAPCLADGVCRVRTSLIANDDELANMDFVRDVRMFAVSLNVTPDRWLDFISDLYRDFNGKIVNGDGEEVLLDFEPLERDGIREWFKDWACKGADPSKPVRLRREARERVRVIATILRSQYPGEAIVWGIRAANDNQQPHANDNSKE